MNAYSGNFDLNSVSSLPRWFGRVVSSESWQDNIEASHFETKSQKGWGYRYRVRYMGLHSASTKELPDEQLPMANVILPVTGGSGIGGFIDTPTLSSGSLVTGFFLDGMAGQEPYIDGILINSNNEVQKSQPQDETGGLQLFDDTYTSGPPETASFVPDYLQAIEPIERATFASEQYRIKPTTPLTIDELRARTAAREAAGPQVGDVYGVTIRDPKVEALLEQERQIGATGIVPGG
jgi:hypothetical protein